MLVKLKINNHKKEINKQRSRAGSVYQQEREYKKMAIFSCRSINKAASSGLVGDINYIIYMRSTRAYYAN